MDRIGTRQSSPHARLQIVTRTPTANKRNKSIVEKSSSDKRVRINEPTTKKDNQPDANVPIQTTTNQEETPLLDDEWEGKGKEQPPDKGDANNRQQGYLQFVCRRDCGITANSYARILGVYKNIMPTYSSYLRFF
jgi:hypothetical protein